MDCHYDHKALEALYLAQIILRRTDGVPRRLSQKHATYLLGRLGAKLDEALDAVERRVRRQENLRMAAQAFIVERLALDHVDARAPDVAGIQGVQQGLLVDDRAARGV